MKSPYMNQKSFNLRTTTLTVRNSMSPATAGRGFLLLALALACFALSPTPNAFGVSPPPDGGYPNNNTAEGFDALLSLTSGSDNTAIGIDALERNTTGSFNTATGAGALLENTIGLDNTAIGVDALFSNTIGANNTANGSDALLNNTTGFDNTAAGANALERNTTGANNTANGFQALNSNTIGNFNTANGVEALFSNTTGFDNTANGVEALNNNTTGGNNTANGVQALNNNTTGGNNIALGHLAGQNLTTGSNNIDIGNVGVATEANTIRIGTEGTQAATFMAGISGATVPKGVAVIIDSSGHLGTTKSSARFKEEIKPMEKASEAILALKPVTFRYKHELDPDGIPQFGLIAEQVEKINPDLVAHDEKGQVYTVRYDAVNRHVCTTCS
jgi:Chaperone of endosialidase